VKENKDKEKEKTVGKTIVHDNEVEEHEELLTPQRAPQPVAQREPSMVDIWNLIQETNHQNLAMRLSFEQEITAMKAELGSRINHLESRVESRRESRSSSPPTHTDMELSKLAEAQLKIAESTLPYFSQNEQDRRKERNKGRDSIMGGLLRFEEEQGASTDRIYVASDKQLSILWTERSVDGFINWLEDIRDFQYANGQRLKSVYSHVGKNIRDYVGDILRLYWPHKYSGSEKVYDATISDLEEAAQILMVPNDLDHFNLMLSHACKNYKVSQNSVSYEATRSNLLRLKTKFTERYNFLKSGIKIKNRMDANPAINFKQGGLLNTWMDLTPQGARDSFVNRLIQQSYKDLEDFFVAFFKIVEENYVMSRNFVTYESRLRLSTELEKTPRRGFHDRDGGRRQYNHPGPRRTDDNLHLIDQEDTLRHLCVIDPDGEALQELVEGLSKDDEDGGGALYAFQSLKKQEGRPADQVCRKYLFDGKCSIKDCKYPHTWRLMMEERKKWITAWGGTPGAHCTMDSIASRRNKAGRSQSSRIIRGLLTSGTYIMMMTLMNMKSWSVTSLPLSWPRVQSPPRGELRIAAQKYRRSKGSNVTEG
jgi:hypothetical protein